MNSTTAPLNDWIAYRARNSPLRTALVVSTRTWNYAELDADVTRTARQLAQLGVGSGDRVAMLLHNGPFVALLAHATLRLGATLVPLNLRLTAAEIAWQVGDCGALLLIVEERTVATSDAARQRHSALSTISIDNAGAAMLHNSALGRQPEADVPLRLAHDPASVLAIIYTSGTTGLPKGAMLTVGNFWWSAIGSALNLGTRDDDRWLACMPLFHVGGLSILLRSAIYGTAAIIHDAFDAAEVNAAIDDDGVTIVSVVAVMLQRMLDARDDRRYPAALRCVLLGGGPAPRPLLERCARLGIPVVQSYGLTETTSQLATLAPEDALRKIGTAGRPIYPNELRTVIEGHDAAVGEPGEIVVRGPVVMRGYAGHSDTTARAIVDGWLHTGDVGTLDADGYLTVLDRRDDLIITGGENVYPAEVEATLLSHPWVVEAGVVGVPHPEWGQSVVAFVRLTDAPDVKIADAADQLRAYCRARLAGYKIPRDVRIANEPLPRTASGKLRRNVLRDRAQ
ncbi:MAG: o-succinylbenzoate--CoA ligase [Gemmatimonadaceae bacterium]